MAARVACNTQSRTFRFFPQPVKVRGFHRLGTQHSLESAKYQALYAWTYNEELYGGVGLAAEELAAAGAAGELAGVDYALPSGEDGFRDAGDLDAFEHGIVHTHVVGFGADDFLLVGIEDDDVGVGAYREGAFAGEEAEKFRRRGGNHFYEAIRRETLTVDAAGVDQAQAMLDAWAAVGDFGEVVFA
jgi:hypothetical protein